MQSWVHLKTKTDYSLCEGTVRAGDWVKRAKELDFPALGVADSNLFGSFEFSQSCMSAGIKPILGCEIMLSYHGEHLPLTIFAKSGNGYKNLLNISSAALCRKEDHGFVLLEDLTSYCEDIICLNPNPKPDLVDGLSALFANGDERNLYFEISRYEDTPESVRSEEELVGLSYEKGIPLVATNNSYFLNNSDLEHEAADILTCIGRGEYFEDEKRTRRSRLMYMRTPKEMEEEFSDLPEALANSFQIAVKCSYCVESSAPILPSFADDEVSEMRNRVFEGLEARKQRGLLIGLNAGKTEEEYIKRIEFEIGVISGMGFSGYFLIVSDFIKWSKENHIPVGPGRGSGAGSLVAFCLFITDLDPLYYGLLFERFLNPERVSMPDFDIDFCQEKRHFVIEYVQRIYGHEKVASIITFGKLQARAVLKDVGRVLSVPYKMVDEICKMIPFNPVEPVTLSRAIDMDPDLKNIREGRGAEDGETRMQKLLDVALILEGLNRHSSIHAAGIIISSEILRDVVPLNRSEDDDLPAVGYSMKIAEKVGLVKFDFLGLKTLTIIDKAVRLVKERHNLSLNIDEIDMNDKGTFELLRKGFTKGVFQLDSFICRETMHKMHADKIEDIIALTSLNRPGPMENIPSYVNRKTGKEKETFYHPLLEDTLQETHGIIIYQEQVMQIAQVLSGYSLGQADLLRRAMGKKVKAEMEAQRKIFVDGAKGRGVDGAQASEIFDVVEKFAGYGFNKSHAAAYSVISIQTAYLKAHYPLEFMIANLNIVLHDTDEISLFVADAQSLKLVILAPDVNESRAVFSAIDGDSKSIVYALSALKGVGLRSAQEICDERERGGKFTDIFDFCRRLPSKVLNKKLLEALANSGAIDSLSGNRRMIVQNIEFITDYVSSVSRAVSDSKGSLFGEELTSSIDFKVELNEFEEYTEAEKMTKEFEALGYYLFSNPLQKYEHLVESGVVTTSDKISSLDIASGKEARIKMMGIVSVVKQRSGAKGRFCFLHLKDAAGIYETSIFNDELITSSKELLVVGAALGVGVSVSLQNNGSVRLSVNRISGIESFAATYTKRNIDTRKPASTLKREAGAGGAAGAAGAVAVAGTTEPIATKVVVPSPSGGLGVCRLHIKLAKLKSLAQIASDFESMKNLEGQYIVYIVVYGRRFLLNGRYNLTEDVLIKLKHSTDLLDVSIF